jgi:hypothetical protein
VSLRRYAPKAGIVRPADRQQNHKTHAKPEQRSFASRNPKAEFLLILPIATIVRERALRIVYLLLVTLCVALLLSSPLTSARAADPYPGPAWEQRMTFAVYLNSWMNPSNNEVVAVYATGEIQPGSADELRAFLDRNAVGPGVTVFLHSPGGSVGQGLAIGRLIRQRRLLTNIGQMAHVRRPPNAGFQEFGPNEPGFCASACSLAFLGGIQRSVMDGSIYAIHDAASRDPLPNPFAVGQKIASEIAVFHADMGVDTKLLDIANSYDSSAGQLVRVSPEIMATRRSG